MTKNQTMPVELSTLDENRFGVRTARAMNLTKHLLPQVMDFCHQQKVQFLITRCSTKDLSAVQAMQRNGRHLIDRGHRQQHRDQRKLRVVDHADPI